MSNSEDIIKKIDHTSDSEVLGRLWEITQDRMSEEKSRHNSINDRASKLITYAFSIFAATGISLITLKDVIIQLTQLHESCALLLLIIPALPLFFLFGKTLDVWRKSSSIIDTHEYRTWNEDDLFQVHLGSDDQAYQRYLLKAAWFLLRHNKKVTDTKMDTYSLSLKSVERAIIALIVTIIASISLNVLSTNLLAKQKSNINKISTEETMTNQSEKEVSNTQSPTSPSPKPTPTPSKGEPQKRDEASLKPTPTPSSGTSINLDEGKPVKNKE